MGKRNMIEITWHGRGGQGTKTVATIIAEMALIEGKYGQGFPEYGPERMGAPVRGFTRISDVPIRIHSAIYNPEVVVVLDPTLLDVVDVAEGLASGGKLIVNYSSSPDNLREKLKLSDGEIYVIDATSISLDELGKDIPNMPMLGALIKITGILSLDTVLKAVKEKFGHKFSERVTEGNIKAIRRAYDGVRRI